jgi:dienelactone hydrolase
MNKIFLAFVLSTLFSIPISHCQIWNNLDRGNYNVGFKALSLYDSTRTINNQKSFRPIQVSIWYPAEKSIHPNPITYKDYFLLSASEVNYDIFPGDRDSTIANYKNLLAQNGINNDAVDNWFNTKMLADKDAVPIDEKFPLVVVAQGNFHSAHHQAFLCEFLASYGYIVITTPSQTRISGQMTDNSQALQSADEQVNDMEFAIYALKNYPDVDVNNIALIGHSFGGRSILLLQMIDENVKCIVSLDGGLGLNTAVEDIQKSGFYNPDNMNVPLLHFYEDSEEFIKPDFSLINSFNKSKRFLVKINDMHHFYFSSFGLVSGTLKGFSPSSKNLADKFKLICDFTRDFLNAIFNDNKKGLDKLKEKFLSVAETSKFISFIYK